MVNTPTSTSGEGEIDMVDDQRPGMNAKGTGRRRRVDARRHHLAQDRPEIAVASCVSARAMARPRVGDEVRVRRGSRYRIRNARIDLPQGATVFIDSICVGDKTTRKSTTGGWRHAWNVPSELCQPTTQGHGSELRRARVECLCPQPL